MKKTLVLSILLAVLVACDPPRVDMSQLQDEKLKHKIVKASDAEILFESEKYGEEILAKTPLSKKEIDSLAENKIAKILYFKSASEVETPAQLAYFNSMESAISNGISPTVAPEFTKGKNHVIYMAPDVKDSVFVGLYYLEINAKYVVMHMETKLD